MSNTGIRFVVSALKNLTTETNLLKSSKNEVAEAIEYDTNHVVFDVSNKSCGQGQLVKVDGVLKILGKDIVFNATGKVKLVTQIGGSRSKITVELHTYDKTAWAEFHNALSENQKKADAILKSIKGDE